MEVIGRKKKELKYVCESIYDSYENINCSLLTHPGTSSCFGMVYKYRPTFSGEGNGVL